jgi:diguanylate cyclase (GGDEF)-like protein
LIIDTWNLTIPAPPTPSRWISITESRIVVAQHMPPRYRTLVVYSLLLAMLAAAWLAYELGGAARFPPWWAMGLCVAGNVFVWQFGLRAPRMGLISMERVPQIGLLLVVDAPVAASICAVASFLWPLINREYSQGSWRVGLLRAVHNAAMTVLMMLVAHRIYVALGGQHPLVDLSVRDVVPLAGMALAAQIVNIGLMALFFRFDGRVVSRVITPAYALSDFVFVPGGVLAAVLFDAQQPAVFGLFVALMVVFVLSFDALGDVFATDGSRAPLARLFEVRRAMGGVRRIDELGERVLAETRALFPFDEFYFVLVDRNEQSLDVRIHERRGERLPRRSKSMSAGLFGWAVEGARPLLVEAFAHASEQVRQRAEVTGKETGSVIIVPLVEGGAVVGLLSVQHTRAGVYSEADLHLMQHLAEQVVGALADARAFEDLEDYRQRLEERVAERTVELERANGEKERLIAAMRERSRTLERESQEDPLTSVANRRSFTRRLMAEMEVALAVGQPLTLAVADLDHFKVVNDRLGHAIGDMALRESALLMQQLCRETDLVARIGGEEFALVLPAMTREGAIEFCNRIRNAIESHEWRRFHPDLAVTISIGLAQWDGTCEVVEFLEAADTQLYRAKRAGRNQVA